MTTVSLDGITTGDAYAPDAAVLAAEMSLVGAALDSRDALEELAASLKPEQFYSQAGIVYAAALAVLADGRPIQSTAVLIELQHRGDLQRVGGGPYLHSLMLVAGIPGALGYEIKLVADDAMRRAAQIALLRGVRDTYAGNWQGAHSLDLIRKGIDEAATDHVGQTGPGVADDMIALLEDLENPPPVLPGVVPPYQDLQDYITSFQPGEVIVVGARPAIGKSTVATDAIRAALKHDKNTVMFTLEMPRRQVLMRMAAAEAQVPFKHIRDYQVSPHDLDRVAEAGSRIAAAPLTIDYAPGCTMDRIRATLRSAARSGPLGLVVVDYIGLMRGPKTESRQQEVSALSGQFKELAGEFEVPVLLLSQLNRNPEQRADRRPQIGDLRESGALEQDADVVILIHREDAHEPDSSRLGEVDLIVAKNRNGATGTVTVVNQLHYARFNDMAPASVTSGRPDLRAA